MPYSKQLCLGASTADLMQSAKETIVESLKNFYLQSIPFSQLGGQTKDMKQQQYELYELAEGFKHVQCLI